MHVLHALIVDSDTRNLIRSRGEIKTERLARQSQFRLVGVEIFIGFYGFWLKDSERKYKIHIEKEKIKIEILTG